jgi:hypothetical protein
MLALVAPAAMLAIITYQTLVRGSPDSRLGDVTPMTAILLGWMCVRTWHVRGWPATLVKPAVTVVTILTVASAVAYGQAIERLTAAGVDGPTNLVRRVRDVGARYAARPLDVFAPAGSMGLPGLSRWINECTGADDRVSVIGFEPQIFVIAERGFAGGIAFYDLGWGSGDRDQRLTVERWARQDVPIVLAMESEWQSFSRDYPRIRAWIDERYEIERQSDFGGNKPVTVWADRTRRPETMHPPMGLPCFTVNRGQ